MIIQCPESIYQYSNFLGVFLDPRPLVSTQNVMCGLSLGVVFDCFPVINTIPSDVRYSIRIFWMPEFQCIASVEMVGAHSVNDALSSCIWVQDASFYFLCIEMACLYKFVYHLLHYRFVWCEVVTNVSGIVIVEAK